MKKPRKRIQPTSNKFNNFDTRIYQQKVKASRKLHQSLIRAPRAHTSGQTVALRLSHHSSKMLLLAELLTRHIFYCSTQGEDTQKGCICSHVIGAGIIRLLPESKKSDVVHAYFLGTACCARHLAATTACHADRWGEERFAELKMRRSWG